MTIAELIRAIESKNRVEKRRQQEKATNDYILADLIGRSIGRIYSSSTKMPDISQAYPSLFDDEEVKTQKQNKLNELSALRFKQFAHSYNTRFREE